MNEKSYKKELQEKEVELKDIVRKDGVFTTEDGKNINWKGYYLKVKIEGIVYSFKLEKVFNDTLEEELENN